MGPSIRFGLVLAATLWVCGGFELYGQTQSDPPRCSGDGLPRGESGDPRCCQDGSIPEGAEHCWCDSDIIRGEYRNAQRQYEVHLPDGVAGVIGCRGTGTGFHISLDHPDSGGRDLPLNMIWVARSQQTPETLPEMADRSAQDQRQDTERVHATDLQIDPPVRTSLSSLPAIELKTTRAEPNRGTLVREVILAKSPDEYVYVVGMITPADQYEKNRKLFKEIVDGFRYVPIVRPASQ